MYDIRQFRPALYTLLILGMSGFALAAQSPGIWVFSVGLILLNGWLIKHGYFHPLPRLFANLVTLLALLYIAYEVVGSGITPIMVIGQFLVILQLVKLYEQRANRDFAQLLILSLLLIVAASINTASLVFGLLLIVYLFLSLYCCLLFHLKIETDHAKAALGLPEEKHNPATLRHDELYLSSSMRRLTICVSVVSVAMAVLVFLFFPRGTGSNLIGGMQFRPSQTLTGFSDSVSFQTVARIQQNNDVVMHVKVWHNDQLVQGTQTILLRGTTLNTYKNWEWTHSAGSGGEDMQEVGPDWRELILSRPVDTWKQEIWLEPTGTQAIFAMPGAFRIASMRDVLHLRYWKDEESLQSTEALREPIMYKVVSRNSLDQASRGQPDISDSDPTPVHTVDPRIRQFGQRPEVSGADEQGPLARRRNPLDGVSDVDEAIARNIERYLQQNYSYSLDLTEARRLSHDQDPIVAFLYDFKRGHCEYFAGAMTLLCQSLGMDARLVVGFKCDEYNSFNSNYIVRQSHAHAWVEVKTLRGWIAFDPTSGRESDAVQTASVWQKAKHFFDFLEYTWANAVVAYDRDSRENLNKNIMAGLANAGNRGMATASDVKDWFGKPANFFVFSSKLLSALIYVLSFALAGAVIGFFWEKYRLRKRARRIGLGALPASVQLRLARQLEFYDELLQLLERHRIFRPPHLTPMEFSNSISYLPSEAFNGVRRLTEIFYRVRYGQQELSGSQQRRLRRVIERIGGMLSA